MFRYLETSNQILRLNETDTNALTARAIAYFELKDYELSLLDWDKSIKLEPNRLEYREWKRKTMLVTGYPLTELLS